MTNRHVFPKQSPDLLISLHGEGPYTREQVEFAIDRYCETLSLDLAKWKFVAQARLKHIGKLLDKDYSDEAAFPWGTLADAEEMRIKLTAEVSKIDGQLTRPARSDAWRNAAVGMRAAKIAEIRRISDWIDAERLRILRDELAR